ncbi:MAG: hypothetical protein ACLGI5_06795 [Thermoleophilia bacterium]
MTRRALTILIAAVVAVGFGTAVIASSLGGGGGDGGSHVMPGGQTMTGTMQQMDDDSGMEGMDMDK